MGLFDKTRVGHSHRIRLLKKVAAVGVAAATLLTGAGIASAKGYSGYAGYKLIKRSPNTNMPEDLAVLGFKDGHPFYCLDQSASYIKGDENKGTWSTRTDIDYRIGAEMVKEHEADQSDLTQASVAYALHDHFDSEHDKFIQTVSGGFKDGNLAQVQSLAAQYWNQAKANTPDSAQVREVKGLARGYVTVDIKTQNGQYVSGVPYQVVHSSNIKIDGAEQGTTANGPVTINWHALSRGQGQVKVQYQSAAAKRMDYGSHQPLFLRDPRGVEIPVGTEFQVSPLYKLDVTTEQKADITSGSTKAVHDKINVKEEKSSQDAQFDPIDDKADVILHFDGNSQTAAKTASKQVDITDAVISKGSVDSPDLAPSDLGMTEWQSGTYWFDIQVAKQGQMESAVDTPDYVESEQTVAPDKAWVLDKKGALSTEDPTGSNKVGADTKTFLPGDPVSAVVNAHAPHGVTLKQFSITDDWSDAAKYVDFTDASKAAVYYDGQDVTSQFDIRTDGTKTVATAKDPFLKTISNLKTDKVVKLIVSGTFRTDYRTAGKTEKLTNSGTESWNGHGTATNIPAVFTWTPNPDKAWIRNTKSDGTGKWEAVIDPDKTNTVGGDQKVYRDGDPVGLTVNGTIPTGLAVKPTIALTDDYGKADYLWDPADKTTWRVYEADVDDYSKSSVADIVNNGKDVTSQFTLAQTGTKITAQASDAYEQTLIGLTKGKQIVLLVPGRINLADGKGNQQVYKDYGYTKNNGKLVKPGVHDTQADPDADITTNGKNSGQFCVNPTDNGTAAVSDVVGTVHAVYGMNSTQSAVHFITNRRAAEFARMRK